MNQQVKLLCIRPREIRLTLITLSPTRSSHVGRKKSESLSLWRCFRRNSSAPRCFVRNEKCGRSVSSPAAWNNDGNWRNTQNAAGHVRDASIKLLFVLFLFIPWTNFHWIQWIQVFHLVNSTRLLLSSVLNWLVMEHWRETTEHLDRGSCWIW